MLREIAQSSQASAQSFKEQEQKAMDAQADGQPGAPLLFERAHDQLLATLHDDSKERRGLEIINACIQQFKIVDEDACGDASGRHPRGGAADSSTGSAVNGTEPA